MFELSIARINMSSSVRESTVSSLLLYPRKALDKVLNRLGCSLEDIPKIVHQNQQFTSELIPRLQSKIVSLEQALTELVEDRVGDDIPEELPTTGNNRDGRFFKYFPSTCK